MRYSTCSCEGTVPTTLVRSKLLTFTPASSCFFPMLSTERRETAVQYYGWKQLVYGPTTVRPSGNLTLVIFPLAGARAGIRRRALTCRALTNLAPRRASHLQVVPFVRPYCCMSRTLTLKGQLHCAGELTLSPPPPATRQNDSTGLWGPDFGITLFPLSLSLFGTCTCTHSDYCIVSYSF